jgi:hypothetical protein
MSKRGSQLLETAEQQIDELSALLSSAGSADLHQPCPGREQLGDGTFGAVASHLADTYLRIAAVFSGDAQHAQPSHQAGHGPQRVEAAALVARLDVGRRQLQALGDLSDERLDAVPPAGMARFCDGQRTTEQVLAAMLKHQGHQLAAVKAMSGERR